MPDVLALIADHYANGEPADFDDLTDIDELLGLHTRLSAIVDSARAVRADVEARIAVVLGPGVRYEYGDSYVTWSHGSRWRAQPGLPDFVAHVATEAPELISEMFNVDYIRKTGLERAARHLGYPPEVVVATLLEKVWDEAPRVRFIPKAIVKEDENGTTRSSTRG